MNLPPPIWDTPPQFVNPDGVKFWLDQESTRYALSKKLKDVQVLFVEETNGNRTRLITQRGEPVYEHQNLENIACHLDIMQLNEQFEKLGE